MIYLKSYCYSKHELPFVISQLIEGWDFIDKLCLYEYNYTHTGVEKEYEMEKVLHLIPENLKKKLYYKKVDLTKYHVNSYNNENLCHSVNEPIQRSWFFNDTNLNLLDNDIIIDIDIDEIIYKDSYSELINELNEKNCLLSIRMNLFFFKQNYLWTDNICNASTICKYSMIKNNKRQIKGINVIKMRDCTVRTKNICGCHMSWVMPIDNMVNKFIKLHILNIDNLQMYKY